MNMYRHIHISYIVYVYEYLRMFIHIYIYSCMNNFLPNMMTSYDIMTQL